MVRRYVVNPPSDGSDSAFPLWAQQITDAINALPQLSVFSGNPNISGVTADPGALGFQNGDSTLSVVWVKTSGSTNTGWIDLA